MATLPLRLVHPARTVPPQRGVGAHVGRTGTRGGNSREKKPEHRRSGFPVLQTRNREK
jgi:hypothetical protein